MSFVDKPGLPLLERKKTRQLGTKLQNTAEHTRGDMESRQ